MQIDLVYHYKIFILVFILNIVPMTHTFHIFTPSTISPEIATDSTLDSSYMVLSSFDSDEQEKKGFLISQS